MGINVSLSSKTFNYITGELSDVSAPANDKMWAMEDFGGFTDDYYPTTNELFNTTGSFNQGGFSNPKLDQDILNSEFSLQQHGGAKRAHPGHLRPARAVPAQRRPARGRSATSCRARRPASLTPPRSSTAPSTGTSRVSQELPTYGEGAQSSRLRLLTGTGHRRRT